MEFIEWIDPVPGRDADGNTKDGCEIRRMSVEDVVNYQREYMHKMRPDIDVMSLDPEELLDEFIAIHWATRKEYPN